MTGIAAEPLDLTGDEPFAAAAVGLEVADVAKLARYVDHPATTSASHQWPGRQGVLVLLALAAEFFVVGSGAIGNASDCSSTYAQYFRYFSL